MRDGSLHNKDLHLNVYTFTLEEVNLLIKVLDKKKLGLHYSIHNLSFIGGKPRIYI
jgi:hypothetical protein